MKTSYYFSNRIREPEFNLIAISNSYPKHLEWLQNMKQYKPLFPGWKLVHQVKNGKISRNEYEELYQELILNRLDPGEVFAELGDDAILLCWEKPGLFCHRRIVARWFYDNLGIKVNEL